MPEILGISRSWHPSMGVQKVQLPRQVSPPPVTMGTILGLKKPPVLFDNEGKEIKHRGSITDKRLPSRWLLTIPVEVSRCGTRTTSRLACVPCSAPASQGSPCVLGVYQRSSNWGRNREEALPGSQACSGVGAVVCRDRLWAQKMPGKGGSSPFGSS